MASDGQVETAAAGGTAETHRALVAVGNRMSQLPAMPWPYTGPAPRPEILSARPTPGELLHALRRRAVLAVGLGMVVGGTLAALVWVFMPIRYEGMALLRISKVKLGVIDDKQSGADEFDTYKRTQQQLIKSNFVLVRAARKLEGAKVQLIRQHKDDPVMYLDNHLAVDFPGDAELLRVSLKERYRDDLPKIINAVVDAYMDEIVNAERNEQLKRRDTLERTVGKNREEIRKKLKEFHQLTKQLGASNSDTVAVKKKMAMDHLNNQMVSVYRLEEQLRDQDVKIMLLKVRQDHPDEKVPDYMLDAELSRDPTVGQLTTRISELKRAIRAQTGMVLNENLPTIKRLKRELVDQEQELDDHKASVAPQISERLNNQVAANGQAYVLPLLEEERSLIAKHLEERKAELGKSIEEVQRLDVNSSELESRKVELFDLQQMTSQMGKSLYVQSLDLESQPRIQVVERATLPQKTDALQKYLCVGFSGLLGFGMVLFGVALVEFQGRRLNSTGEVNQGLGIPVIGELPPLSGRTWRKIRAGGTAGNLLQSILTEAIDSIRTTLVHTTSVESPRVVMVTSAEAQEGKTTVASQLAASLARSGRRTLLIDGDLRKPAAHRVFELPLEPGLCEVLRGEVQHEAAVQPTHSANLWLLTAGRCDANSLQGLSHSPLTNLLTALKAEFDFIIIDTAPVLKVADPMLIGQHVDAAVLSVLRDLSTVPGVYEASSRLSSVGITVVGAVVNGIIDRSRHYYGGAMGLMDNRPHETSA